MPGARDQGWSAVGAPGLVRWGLRSWLLVGVLVLATSVLWLLSQVSGFVVPLVIAAVLGALFAPLVDRLRAHGVPRPGGALLVLLGLTAVVVGSIWLVVRGIVAQAPQIGAQVTAGLDTLTSRLADQGIDVGSGASVKDRWGLRPVRRSKGSGRPYPACSRAWCPSASGRPWGPSSSTTSWSTGAH